MQLIFGVLGLLWFLTAIPITILIHREDGLELHRAIFIGVLWPVFMPVVLWLTALRVEY